MNPPTSLYTVKLTCANCARSLVTTVAGWYQRKIHVGCAHCKQSIMVRCPQFGWMSTNSPATGLHVEIEPIGLGTIKP